jgi:mannosyltransferase PIG-V
MTLDVSGPREMPAPAADPSAAVALHRRVGAALLRTAPIPPQRLERSEWLYLAAVLLLSRVMVVFLGVLGTAFIPQEVAAGTFVLHPLMPGDDLWVRLFSHFDSGWYQGISHGYALPGSGPDWLKEWAFFPLYPLAVRPVALLLAAVRSPGSIDALAGVIMSHAALFAAVVYCYRLARAELSPLAARRAVTYLLVFPASFFFSAVYPESLYLLCSVGAFYHARRRQWALAGVWCALALLTRPQGLFLLLPLALEFVAALRGSGFAFRRAASGLWLGLPLVALGGYALYSHVRTGYWLAFATSASRAWGHRLTPPIYPLVRYLLAPDLGSALAFDFRAVNFAVAVLFLALVVVAWRRLPPAYGVWLLICVLFPLSTNGHYFFSLARYVSTAFPAFFALAAWALGASWDPAGTRTVRLAATVLDLRDRLVMMPSLLLLPLYVVMFVNGIYAAI